MNFKEFKGIIKPRLTPLNISLLFIVLALTIISGAFILQRASRRGKGSITENQIKIQKGEKIVIVDKNGLIEYRTPVGVFYETWDSAQIDSFFASMEAKARQYLDNPVPEGGSGYYVTIYIDGREVTVYIEDDEELEEVFDQFNGDENGSLGDLFNDFFGDDDGDGDGQDSQDGGTPTVTLTPTPTTIAGNGGEYSEFEMGLFDCTLYEQQVTGRTIISNTLCVLEQEE